MGVIRMKMSKLAIIGLGHVGSAVLTQAMAMNLAAEIVCIDINEKSSSWRSFRRNSCDTLYVCTRYESLFRRF